MHILSWPIRPLLDLTRQSFSWCLQMAALIVFAVSGFWRPSWVHLVIIETVDAGDLLMRIKKKGFATLY